jgi:hypothetical protein
MKKHRKNNLKINKEKGGNPGIRKHKKKEKKEARNQKKNKRREKKGIHI